MPNDNFYTRALQGKKEPEPLRGGKRFYIQEGDIAVYETPSSEKYFFLGEEIHEE